MSMSAIDRRIKNASLAVDRARTNNAPPEYVHRVENELARAMRRKAELKVTNR